MNKAPDSFAAAVVGWQQTNGRHDLPWQKTRDPYRIWLSEIMLQQTQVSSVIPYYARFLERFPDLFALAAAEPESVLALWAGLGYYARARNLHRCARLIVSDYGGRFPASPVELAGLPGIGRSTAAAIAAFAFGARAAILDGNVKRVLCRCFAIDGFPGSAPIERELWQLAEALLPSDAIEAYTQGLMDLGTAICTRRQPDCPRCPVAGSCLARRANRQHELPTARPGRRPPERLTTFLLLDDGSGFLLEARPAPGIWGGLLAPPELAAEETPAAALVRLGCRWRDARQLPARQLPDIRHSFTHFRLTLRPVLIGVEPAGRAADPGGLRSVAYRDIAAAPLPAPIRRLLANLVAVT